MKITVVAGSPAHSTRGASLLAHLTATAENRGVDVARIEVRTIPADELVAGSMESRALLEAAADIESSVGVVIATPVYKAAYTGLLKCFLDTLPSDTALRGKVVFPIVTAASPTHVLALDYALKPMLASLGSSIFCAGIAMIDSQFEASGEGAVALKADALVRFDVAVAEFLDLCSMMYKPRTP